MPSFFPFPRVSLEGQHAQAKLFSPKLLQRLPKKRDGKMQNVDELPDSQVDTCSEATLKVSDHWRGWLADGLGPIQSQ